MQVSARRVTQLDEAQLEEAIGVFARAFQNDPLFAYGWPHAVERARWLPPIARWNLAHGRLFGTILAVSGEYAVDGILIAYPPGGEVFTVDRMTQSGYDAMRAALDAPSWDRLQRVFDVADEALQRAAPEPHWYLDAIAVDPARQGTGAGSALIQAVHDLADADGVSTILLTFQSANVDWYGRRGYEIVCSAVEPTSGLQWWGCQRKPRLPSSDRPDAARAGWAAPDGDWSAAST